MQPQWSLRKHAENGALLALLVTTSGCALNVYRFAGIYCLTVT
jgi:hypothetical protein